MLGQFNVRGSKAFNDIVQGQKINSAKLIVEVPQRQIHSDIQYATGNDNITFQVLNMQEYEKLGIPKMKFPALCEIDYNLTTKGYEVISVKYIKELPN